MTEQPVVSLTILFTNSTTISFLPWPIILLTIELVVAAKDQPKIPKKPNTFRIILVIAWSSGLVFLSTNIKKKYQENFNRVLGPKRCERFFKMDGEFKRKLLERIRKQNANPSQQRPKLRRGV